MRPYACLLICTISASAVLAEDTAIYDANPAHPWNRLSAALQSDAPLRFETPGDHAARVFAGSEYQTALNALDDFMTRHAEKSIKDPVKRALLQSELWATFDQVSDGTGERQAERWEISRRCATLIKRLALSDSEIAALPDPYALAVKGRLFPTVYDPAHREQLFLPDDLLQEGRAWIMLSSSAREVLQPAATQHVKATQGRSVFYALVRLPAGRQATLDYLKQLAEFPQPYAWNDLYKVYPYARSAVEFNPGLPQFPAGTQVALVRRMILINSGGAPVVAPIVESIQIRVYVIDPREAQPGERDNQVFLEWELAPEQWLRGKDSLRAAALAPRTRHPTFASATLFSPGNNCNNCHGGVGVLSLNTYTHAFGAMPSSPWFEPSSEAWQNRNTLDWKKRDYTWGLLSALLQSNQ